MKHPTTYMSRSFFLIFACFTYYRCVLSWLGKAGYVGRVQHLFADFRDNPIYVKYYLNITRTALLGVVPFSALIYFTIKIYRRFLRTRARYSRENSNNSTQV